MDNTAFVKKVQKISLRFWRKERYLLSLDINDPRRKQWNALRREQNRQYRYLFNKLFERGIEPSSIPLYKWPGE